MGQTITIDVISSSILVYFIQKYVLHFCQFWTRVTLILNILFINLTELGENLAFLVVENIHILI